MDQTFQEDRGDREDQRCRRYLSDQEDREGLLYLAHLEDQQTPWGRWDQEDRRDRRRPCLLVFPVLPWSRPDRGSHDDPLLLADRACRADHGGREDQLLREDQQSRHHHSHHPSQGYRAFLVVQEVLRNRLGLGLLARLAYPGNPVGRRDLGHLENLWGQRDQLVPEGA